MNKLFLFILKWMRNQIFSKQKNEYHKTESQNNSNDTQNKPDSVDNIPNPYRDLSNRNEQHKSEKEIYKCPECIVSNSHKKENGIKEEQVLRRIEVIGNIVMAGFTCAIFLITYNSLKNNEESSKRNDSLGSIRDSLYRVSIDSQIAYLKESKRQFEFANKPHIKFGAVGSDIFEFEGKCFVNIKCEFSNLGVHAAKAFQGRNEIKITRNPNFRNLDIINKIKYTPSDSYIDDAKATKTGSYDCGTFTISQPKYDSIIKHKAYIYLIGELCYKNLWTGTDHIYRYAFKMSGCDMNDFMHTNCSTITVICDKDDFVP